MTGQDYHSLMPAYFNDTEQANYTQEGDPHWFWCKFVEKNVETWSKSRWFLKEIFRWCLLRNVSVAKNDVCAYCKNRPSTLLNQEPPSAWEMEAPRILDCTDLEPWYQNSFAFLLQTSQNMIVVSFMILRSSHFSFQ